MNKYYTGKEHNEIFCECGRPKIWLGKIPPCNIHPGFKVHKRETTHKQQRGYSIHQEMIGGFSRSINA